MSITLVLIIMTGIISYQSFNSPQMRSQLIFYPSYIKESGQYYRFLTHGFIHGSMGHLLINMYVLYLFGGVIETLFNQIFGELTGRIVYLLMYLSAIVISSIPSYFRNLNNPTYRALGASGATSALVFAYIIFDPWQWFLFPPLPAIIFGVAYLWYSNYMDKKGADNIGHNAHFWGAIYGLAFTIISVAYTKPALLDYFMAKLMEGPGAPNF